MSETAEKKWPPIPAEVMVDFQGQKGPYEPNLSLSLCGQQNYGSTIAWSGILVTTPSPIGTIELYFEFWHGDELPIDFGYDDRTLPWTHVTEMIDKVVDHPAVQAFKQAGALYFAALPESCLAHRGYLEEQGLSLRISFGEDWEPQDYLGVQIGSEGWEEEWPFTAETFARESMESDYIHEGLQAPTEWPPRCAGESCPCHQVPPRETDTD